MKYKFLKSHESACITCFEVNNKPERCIYYLTKEECYNPNDAVVESDEIPDDLLILYTSKPTICYNIVETCWCLNVNDILRIQIEAFSDDIGDRPFYFKYYIYYESEKSNMNEVNIAKLSLNNLKYLQTKKKELFKKIQKQILEYYSDKDGLIKKDQELLEYCFSQLSKEEQLLYIIK